MLLTPREKTNAHNPPMIRLELKIVAVVPDTPRSLRASSNQLNHGESCIAVRIMGKISKVAMPHAPMSFLGILGLIDGSPLSSVLIRLT